MTNEFSANKVSRSLAEAVEAAVTGAQVVDRRGELNAAMKSLLADSFVLYVSAHIAHWNVEGKDFPQLHEFFGDIYAEVYEKLDDTAEKIRALGYKTPASVQDILHAATPHIPFVGDAGSAAMVADLLYFNRKVLDRLDGCLKLAKEFNEEGLQNFLQDMIDRHNKIQWKLNATSQV